MKRIFEIKKIDTDFYNEKIRDFLPEKIIDIHTHVWLKRHRRLLRLRPEPVPRKDPACNNVLIPNTAAAPHSDPVPVLRTAAWPELVAAENSIESLIETYKLLFPGKEVTPLIFSNLSRDDDIDTANEYVRTSSCNYRCPSLIFAAPWWNGEEFERKIKEGGHLGCKVYLNMAALHIKADDIRIFDFLPRHQLEVLNRHGWIVMLHIPGSGRLRGRQNLEQMLEIEERYPGVKLIIAHVGRAYCPEDVGDAFDVLSGTGNMLFDISANTNNYVFERLVDAVGPGRILFGSDLPILRMRAARVCEKGNYVNIVPEGMYGDVTGDSHMREAKGDEAEKITFLLYEEIEAFRIAALSAGLTAGEIADVFYNNAAKIFKELGYMCT
ncbi:MAG: amidohydrolase family protein [Eubacteriales bacterium]|nr:amidohydrolase family protein [Eubacteriales bacterium]